MVMSPVGVRTKNHCAGEGQQQFSSQEIVGYSTRLLKQTRRQLMWKLMECIRKLRRANCDKVYVERTKVIENKT
jgi:hypothetical protein